MFPDAIESGGTDEEYSRAYKIGHNVASRFLLLNYHRFNIPERYDEMLISEILTGIWLSDWSREDWPEIEAYVERKYALEVLTAEEYYETQSKKGYISTRSTAIVAVEKSEE
jgi:hypothetical protein